MTQHRRTCRAGADHPLLPGHRHHGHRRRAGCRADADAAERMLGRRARRHRPRLQPVPRRLGAADGARQRRADRRASASCSSRRSRSRSTRPSAPAAPSTPPSATPSPRSATTPTWTRSGPGRPRRPRRSGRWRGTRTCSSIRATAPSASRVVSASTSARPPRRWPPTVPRPASPAEHRWRRAGEPGRRRRRRRLRPGRRLGRSASPASRRPRPTLVDQVVAITHGGPGQLGHRRSGPGRRATATSTTSSIRGPGTASSPTGSWSRPPAPAASRPTS